MEKTNWPNKLWNVWAALFKNKEKYIFSHTIREGIEDKITEGDLDIILEELAYKGVILCRVYTYEGIASDLYEYRLSFKGISAFEDSLKLNKKTVASKETKTNKKVYTHKEIAIAYRLMDKNITKENAKEILERHSENKSPIKLLQNKNVIVSKLSELSNNRSADTKHLKNLKKIKELIIEMKNKEAIKKIDKILSKFKTVFEEHY